ncbi:MAG: 2-C-methyl-D-erythritol 4-phosphate cytidylyltransferase [Verrucomicrobia bacterium]|nr:2-C-methyl-D-erythritol 4-phosphate cytidylyltransferase [Verrucomicrobiota bacterium]
MNAGIIAAMGKSATMGSNVDRGFLNLGTSPVLAYSLQAFEKCPDIDSIVLIVKKDRLEAAHAVVRMFGCSKVIKVIASTPDRSQSVEKAIEELGEDCKIVVIQDAYCPCITSATISMTIKTAKRYGTGIAAQRIEDSVKLVEKGQLVSKSLDPSVLWIAQSPQAFKIDLLKAGLEAARKKKITPDDESVAVGMVIDDVRLVPVTGRNIRINTADDLTLAATVLKL